MTFGTTVEKIKKKPDTVQKMDHPTHTPNKTQFHHEIKKYELTFGFVRCVAGVICHTVGDHKKIGNDRSNDIQLPHQATRSAQKIRQHVTPQRLVAGTTPFGKKLQHRPGKDFIAR